MAFTIITGPMKSGKSMALISAISPYGFANKKMLVVQSDKNVRDDGIVSRSGLRTHALKVAWLHSITEDFDAIAIDEANMFDEADAGAVQQWLLAGKDVFVSGLDLDYRGRLTPFMRRMLELKPDCIVLNKAVCDVCRKYEAVFSQILHLGQPVLAGLPVVVPEDGPYEYEARCRQCFLCADDQQKSSPVEAAQLSA